MDDLLAHTDHFSDGNIRLRILDLKTLIEVKVDAGRPKDRLAVPVLLAVMRAREGRS